MKKTILIDFDGTLNSYRSGWKGAKQLPDPPIPGAIGFLWKLYNHIEYEPVIFTTRVFSDHPDVEAAEEAIRDWLVKYGLPRSAAGKIDITAEKRPAALIIDDKAFRFEGKYPSFGELVDLTRKKKR